MSKKWLTKKTSQKEDKKNKILKQKNKSGSKKQ
jgi:hypothetical protein